MKIVTLKYPEKLQSEVKRSGLQKWQWIVLLCILAYEGAGALLGGILLIMEPDGRLMNMPVDIMNGAFRDFMIPGIILFIMGILNTAAFVVVLRKASSDWFLAALAMGGMIIWFWVEIAILQEIHWLHLMWGLPVLVGGVLAIPLIPWQETTIRKALLYCGILSSVLYVAINIIVAMQWEEYDSASQTVSELSAIGAPTRILWMVLCTPYTLLIIAFAYGVWRSAGENRLLRFAGGLLIAYGALGVFWPLAPMHLRETLAAGGGTWSDTMHIVLAVITQIIYLFVLALTAAALGLSFRIYSIATFLVLLIFGILTFMDAPDIAANQPTPWIGVWERINIGVFLVWVVVLAIVLLPEDKLPESINND